MKEEKKVVLAVIVFLILVVIILGVLIIRISKVTNTIANNKKTSPVNISTNTSNIESFSNITQNSTIENQTFKETTSESNTNFNRKIEEAEEPLEVEYTEKPEPVTNKAYYQIVYKCMMNSLNKMYLINSNNDANKQEAIKALYCQFSENFKKQNNITLENLAYKMSNFKRGDFVEISEMLEQRIENSNILRYILRNKFIENENEYYLNFIIYLDYFNLTYAIEPISTSVTKLEDVDLKINIESIEKNDYNKYGDYIITKVQE